MYKIIYPSPAESLPIVLSLWLPAYLPSLCLTTEPSPQSVIMISLDSGLIVILVITASMVLLGNIFFYLETSWSPIYSNRSSLSRHRVSSKLWTDRSVKTFIQHYKEGKPCRLIHIIVINLFSRNISGINSLIENLERKRALSEKGQ